MLGPLSFCFLGLALTKRIESSRESSARYAMLGPLSFCFLGLALACSMPRADCACNPGHTRMPAPSPLDLDFVASDGFKLTGPYNDGESAGAVLAVGGDINFDGIDDWAIGVPGSDANGTEKSGEVLVFFGRPGVTDFGSLVTASELDGVSGFRVEGDIENRRIRVGSMAGDVNQDGVVDLVIGSQGGAWVLFGRKDNQFPPVISVASLQGSTGFAIVSSAGEFGTSVASGGDVNNDLVHDIVIGAPSATNTNGLSSGRAFVVFGKPAGQKFNDTVDADSLDGSNGFIFNGRQNNDKCGVAVGLADTNGDGIDDVLVGASQTETTNTFSNQGAVYVLYGRTNTSSFPALLSTSNVYGDDGWKIYGKSGNDQLGRAFGKADMNGDSIPDLVIGAWWADTEGIPGSGEIDNGEVYVVFGSPNFPSTFDLNSLDGSNGFTIYGSSEDDNLGSAVSARGADINQDGIEDTVISAYRKDIVGVNRAGVSYVLFGQREEFPSNFSVSILDGENGVTLQGTTSQAYAGQWVATGGDVNNDGRADVLVGAPIANGYRGEVYMYYGVSTPWVACNTTLPNGGFYTCACSIDCQWPYMKIPAGSCTLQRDLIKPISKLIELDSAHPGALILADLFLRFTELPRKNLDDFLMSNNMTYPAHPATADNGLRCFNSENELGQDICFNVSQLENSKQERQCNILGDE